MNNLNTYIKILFVLSIVFLFVKNVIFIQEQHLWSPIDEYAHMDYIAKVSSGKIPKLSDQLSPEIIQHIQKFPEKNLHKDLIDVTQLGFAGFSYEAHHPPIYYIVLAVPYKVLNTLNIELFQKLRFLRLISFLLYTIGILLVIPIFKQLRISGRNVPVIYALGCVIFGLLVASHQRYGLGNNMLSPLMVNLTCLFLLKAINQKFKTNFILSIFFGCIALLTSYTNILIIPFLFSFCGLSIIKKISLKNILWSLFFVSCTIGFVFFWRHQSHGDKNVEAFIYLMLQLLIPAGFLTYRYFMEIFLADAFTITFIKAGFSIFKIIIGLSIVNGIFSLIYTKTILKSMKWVLGVYFLAVIFLISTFLLNKYIGGVNWYALRHYSGFIPVFYITCTGFLLVISSKAKRL